MQANEARAKSPIDLSDMAPEKAAQWVVQRYWSDGMPIHPEQIARSLGIEVVFMSGHETSPVCTSPDGAVRIAVDRKDSIHRQRFAIAHVLGHIVLGHQLPSLETWDSFGNDAPDPDDRSANLFAAALLVPTRHLRWCVTSGWMRNLEQIVDAFSVPESVVLFRYERMRAGH